MRKSVDSILSITSYRAPSECQVPCWTLQIYQVAPKRPGTWIPEFDGLAGNFPNGTGCKTYLREEEDILEWPGGSLGRQIHAPEPKMALWRAQRLIGLQHSPDTPDACLLAPEFPEQATSAFSCNTIRFQDGVNCILGRQMLSLWGLECSTEVKGPSQGNNRRIWKLKPRSCDGINTCSQANLPMIIQNFTFSEQQDSFTQSVWKFCCSISPACEGHRTKSALAYFVSKQLSDSISTNKKGYNYTLIL